MDEKHITIEFAEEQAPGTSEAPEVPGQTNPEYPIAPKDDKGGVKKLAGIAVAGMVAKKSVGYVTSNIGKWTGSSQTQQSVDNAMSVIGHGAAIVANPALGIANLALSLATKALDYAFERKWQDREVEELRRRSGYYLSGDSR